MKVTKKTYHRFFQRIWSGAKTCEIRKDMEPVEVGDYIELVETSEKTGKLTGRMMTVEITDIVTAEQFNELFGTDLNITVMSIVIRSQSEVGL